MYLLIIALPLVGTLVTGLGGRWIGRKGSNLFSTTCVVLCVFFSSIAFFEVGLCGVPCYISLSPWISSGALNISWGFLFDSLTTTMLVVITSISSLVHLYSIQYMEHDPHCPRFMSFLEIFTFFMILLVTADNFVQMFLGWEGVGLASYLLINFWYTRLCANQAAIKALVVNRVGDFGLSLGIFTIFYLFGSVDYEIVFSSANIYTNYSISFCGFSINTLTLIGIFLLIGAVGKSAQLGLHTWLPDAMEGPTPVSALIHAATMVTAGVFLIVRCSPLIDLSSDVLLLITLLGSSTAFFASIVGVFQNDIKRVIAYSTCSQLGYMVFVCGLSYYNVGMFHLVNHAFFKALLFLSAGSVIHALSNEQDMRRMGSLANSLPITYAAMLIGSLSLAGFPFLTGFYSKDLIIEITQISYYSNLQISFGVYACWLANISVLFTSFYTFRLIFLTFIKNTNSYRKHIENIHESPPLILIPLILLAISSIFVGFLTKDIFVGIGTPFWGNAINILPTSCNLLEVEFMPSLIKWLPFVLSSMGAILAYTINVGVLKNNIQFAHNHLFRKLAFSLSKKLYWDKLYNSFIVSPLMYFGYNISFKNLDRGFIEFVGPYGISRTIKNWSTKVIKIQTGQLTHYTFFVIFGLCSLLLLVPVWDFLQFLVDVRLLVFCFIALFVA
uniref:NADH-ubiquinone oxidoreductase chain 5 n=1 Tax=Pyropia yezoensis TaxID=2788 RepID=I0B711_PYRYE|nr:NADH dehydrogenase subunit 5 [Neopyropia yezoensis]AFH57679.1 NADH dehydrogenase subunit 5 [Neopyropia yezoensis]QGA30551.1 NADH dehydrogenase subunit 5 [Neopyropia yezoensis]